MESVSQLAKKAIGLQPIERIRLIEAILYSLDKSDPAFSNIRANLRSSVSTFNLQPATNNSQPKNTGTLFPTARKTFTHQLRVLIAILALI